MKCFNLERSFLLALAFTFLIVSASAVPGQNRRDERRAVQLASEGDKQFRSRDYRGAVDSYAQAIALNPRAPQPRFWKGVAHVRLDEPQMALPELDAAMANGYDKPLDIYLTRWRIHFANKNYDQAMSDVRAGIAIDAENADLQLALGDLSLAKGDAREAANAYINYLAKNPSNAEVHLGLARTYAVLGEPQKQVASAQEALRRGTMEVADAHLLVGDGYEEMLQFAEAVEAFKKAVTARPDAYITYRRLAEGYRALANFDEAIATSRRALRLFPTDGEIYTDISWYYSLADRHQDAVDSAQAGIRFRPDSHMAYTNLCRAYNDLRKYELAASACNTALKLKPNDGESLFYLARANKALGKAAEASRQTKLAVTGLEEAARMNPTYSDAHYLLGGAYFDDGQTKKALESYQRVLALSPNFVKALYNVGIIHLIDGRKDLAMEQQKRLQTIDPKYAAMLKEEIDKL